ncbi:hypothetical protein BTZ20_4627 [Rhodococcus sp. MTM3W5.2]|nr:hypothetical protein BTZ20_4627 [Rhodococcus sp. MTM3W5.2]
MSPSGVTAHQKDSRAKPVTTRSWSYPPCCQQNGLQLPALPSGSSARKPTIPPLMSTDRVVTDPAGGRESTGMAAAVPAPAARPPASAAETRTVAARRRIVGRGMYELHS